MSIRDTYQNLKSVIVGTKTTNIDKKLDLAIKDITSYKTNSGRNGYIDLVKSLISKNNSAGDITSGNSIGGGLFSQTSSPSAMGQAGRLSRYKTYDAIISNINYCYRALDVLTDNILSPDDITKSSLEIQPINYIKDDIPTDSKSTNIKEVIKKIKLEKNLRNIIKNTLAHGDYFCEIADSKTALTSKAYLSEDFLLNDERKQILNFKVKKNNYKLVLDYTSYFEEKENINSNNKETPLSEISLLFHPAKKVLKLQSDMFPLCFGYLIFPISSVDPQISIQHQAVDDICSGMLKNLNQKIPQMSEFSNDVELKSILSAMIKETGANQLQTMSVRYVPPNKIQHFMVPSTKFHPYGESIFDSCQFTAKILIALETSLAIQRINRSTEKRKISVEVGLPRDAKKMIEGLKEEFRKRKVSLDNFGTIDTIPSVISTFEDIYIPMKDGKPFVDISTFTEGNVDIRSKVDELKFLRDSCIASLSVPPSFIGIEENLSNKNALSEENILFARTIINHQKYLSEQISNLIEKVFTITHPEEALTIMDSVSINLSAPKSLQFEREARYMNELASLIETLERINIPKEYTMKKYLTNIDWEDLKRYRTDEEIDKKLKTAGDKEDDLGGVGGF